MSNDKAPETANTRPAVGGPVERTVGPGAKAPKWWHCDTHGQGSPTSWGCPACVREMRRQIAEQARMIETYMADIMRDQAEIARLRAALTELRDRIRGHPAYADLTEADEIETGGDTAELSYLARVADDALGQIEPPRSGRLA